MLGWLRRLFGSKSASGSAAPDRWEPTLQTTDKVVGEPRTEPRLPFFEAPLRDPPTLAPRSPTNPAWLARMPAKVLFVDVETTGLNAGADRIVSFAGILVTTADLARGTLDMRYGHYIVDPGRLCHPHAAAVHGYSDWLLRHQQPFAEIVGSVSELIDNAELIVAHNAEFDVGFINAEMAKIGRPAIGKPVYCTIEGYRALRDTGSARLDEVAAEMGLSRAGSRHGALEDAWLAMMVYFWLHDCPYRIQFSAFSNPLPTNLRPVPPIPEQAEAVEQAVTTLRNMFSRTVAAPPRISPTFAPRGFELPESNDVATSVVGGPANDDLRGISFAIEYTDAGGRETTRRITLHDLRQAADGRTYLQCFCHECREQRTFRFDRIRSIIDLDEVFHEPANFFQNELRTPIQLTSPVRPTPSAPRETRPMSLSSTDFDNPGIAQRRVARDGARLLAALARSDGIMHAAEIEVIIDYIAECAGRHGIATEREDRLALAAYLKRQRPSADTLDECLARLARASAEEQRLFLRSAIALAEADGQRDTTEVTMLFDLQRRLEITL